MSKEVTGHLVVAFFETIEGADYAAFQLQEWGKANPDASLGAIDVMSKNAKGKIETRGIGPTHAGKGAKIGVAAGIVAGILSGGISVVGGALAGAALGGVGGVFSKEHAEMTAQDKETIKARLDAGNVAVLAMCDPAGVEGVVAQLDQLGGQVQGYEISESASPAEPSAPDPAQDDAPAN